MLSVGGVAEASTIYHVRSGWKKIRETSRVFSYNMKWKLYTACVRSVIPYGSEVWPLKESDISRISRTDMEMVRWMCNVSLRDRKSSAEVRNRLGVANIVHVMCQIRLRWFGHVERMDRENPVSSHKFIEVGG